MILTFEELTFEEMVAKHRAYFRRDGGKAPGNGDFFLLFLTPFSANFLQDPILSSLV